MRQLRFAYGTHALLQMKERHISKALVEESFLAPDVISPARKGRHALAKNVRKDISLVVVFRENRHILHIITAYFTDKKI